MSSETLLAYLQNGLKWSDQQLEEKQTAWKSAQREILADLEGVLVRVNPENTDLEFCTFPELEVLATVDLWDEACVENPSPRTLAWLDGHKGSYLEDKVLPKGCRPGLVLADQFSFAYSPELETAPHLFKSNALFDLIYKDNRTRQVDLLHVPARDLLLVGVRELGEVLAISLSDYQILASWEVREESSSLAINMSVDPAAETLYITDNISSDLWIIQLKGFTEKVYQSGLGPLGNLFAAAESGHLYLSLLVPQLSLVYFDTSKMTAKYSVDIKGNSWTAKNRLAQDPLVPLDDGKKLAFLTWIIKEGKEHPAINIIDTAEVTILKRYAVKESAQPVFMGEPEANPYLKMFQLDFQTWLEEQGLFKLSAMQTWQEEQATLASELGPVQRKPLKLKPVNHKFRIFQPPKPDEKLWDRIDEVGDELELPNVAVEAIVDLINWAFYRMTLTNLRIHSDEMKRIYRIAQTIKEELRYKRVVLAKVDKVLGRHQFQTPIDRDDVIKVMREAKLSGEGFRLEDLCPMCQALMDETTCPNCSFRLELPEDQRLPLTAYSAEAATALFPGQILLAHKALSRLLTLNIWRQPVHDLDVTIAGLKGIASGVALPNQNFLVADDISHKVMEISPGGEKIWWAKLALKKPVQVTWYQAEKDLHYLIVDQGNARILELDPAGKHWRRYPAMKTPDEDKLVQPVDVQLLANEHWLISDPGSQRVLEVDRPGAVVQTFGANQGINHPLAARRNLDGTTEIIDASASSWMCFDVESQLTEQFIYWPPEVIDGDSWRDKPAPSWAGRLHNGEWILRGEDYFMLMAPALGLIRWVAALPDPGKEDELLKVRFKSSTNDDLRKQKQVEYTEALKKVQLVGEEEEEKIQQLAKYVHAIKIKAGEWLARPGETPNGICFLIEGELEMVAAEEDEPLIQTFSAGEICGQESVAALDILKDYQPGLRAKTDARMLLLERGQFKKTVVVFPRLFSIVKSLNQDFLQRLKQFKERKTELAQDDLRHRLAESRMRDLAIFKGSATQDFFDALANIVHPHAFMPSHDVFGRGESGGSMFLIIEGKVGLLRKGEKEAKVIISEGDVFGEMSLIFDMQRNVTAQTLDYCKFFEFEHEELQKIWARFPWFHNRLRDLANQRKEENLSYEQEFAKKVGTLRPDLPTVKVMPLGLREDGILFYYASLQNDCLLGINLLGEVLWYWGNEAKHQLYQPTRSLFLGDSILVTDSGNNRVIEIDIESREIKHNWKGQFNRPRSGALTPEGFLLVADEGNERLLVLNEEGRELWEYKAPNEIMSPAYAELTPQNTILFADEGLHKVYEISRQGELIWSFGSLMDAGKGESQLSSPKCVRRLDDGSTLIADSGNHRLVWIRPEQSNKFISLAFISPPIDIQHCDVLESGEIIVFSGEQNRFVRISRSGEVTWQADLTFTAKKTMVQQTQFIPPDERWILDLDRMNELEERTPTPDLEVHENVDALGDSIAKALEEAQEDHSTVTRILNWSEISESSGISREDLKPSPKPLETELSSELGDMLDDMEKKTLTPGQLGEGLFGGSKDPKQAGVSQGQTAGSTQTADEEIEDMFTELEVTGTRKEVELDLRAAELTENESRHSSDESLLPELDDVLGDMDKAVPLHLTGETPATEDPATEEPVLEPTENETPTADQEDSRAEWDSLLGL